MLNSSALYTNGYNAVDNIVNLDKIDMNGIRDGWYDPDYKAFGKTLTNFLLSVVHYKAPNVNVGRATKWDGLTLPITSDILY